MCVTRDQLAALLATAGQTGSNSWTQGSNALSTAAAPPTISINGNNPAHINIGDTYQDLGATAKDSTGHDLGVKTILNGALVSDIVIDTSTTSTETIDYVATDTWGNTATATRSVIIEPPAPPVTDTAIIEAPASSPPSTATIQ